MKIVNDTSPAKKEPTPEQKQLLDSAEEHRQWAIIAARSLGERGRRMAAEAAKALRGGRDGDEPESR